MHPRLPGNGASDVSSVFFLFGSGHTGTYSRYLSAEIQKYRRIAEVLHQHVGNRFPPGSVNTIEGEITEVFGVRLTYRDTILVARRQKIIIER